MPFGDLIWKIEKSLINTFDILVIADTMRVITDIVDSSYEPNCNLSVTILTITKIALE